MKVNRSAVSLSSNKRATWGNGGSTKKVGPGTASTVLFRGLATPDKDVTSD